MAVKNKMHIIKSIAKVKESGIIKPNSLVKADCMKAMDFIPDKSIDLILCDLPYGSTSSDWDTQLPFKKLWMHYNRVIKERGNIVLFGAQPFTNELINSNPKIFRYELIWNKGYSTNFQLSKKQPLRIHESICIFYKKMGPYNPLKIIREKPRDYRGAKKEIKTEKGFKHFHSSNTTTILRTDKYPTSILDFNGQADECNNRYRLHPNQKPLSLIEYLIRTYSNEGALILDNCSGVATTAIGAINTNRKFICIEKERGYFNLGINRVQELLLK